MTAETETNDRALAPIAPELTPYQVIEAVISSGDIGKMTPAQRVAFYWRTCETLGLNPLTQPFQYLSLGGKIVLYARKDATEQLRRVNRVSVTELRRERDDDLGTYTVYAHGKLPDGREDTATGVVAIKGLGGEALANQLMKAETKAKRRLTLSLVGLGFLDESEVEGIGERLDVDPGTGELPKPQRPSLLETVERQAAALADEQAAAASEADEAPPEPEGATTTTPPDEPGILARPMEVAESAQHSPAEIEAREAEEQAAHLAELDVVTDAEGLGTVDVEQDQLAAAMPIPPATAPVEGNLARPPAKDPTAPPGLTIQELADKARGANIGKLRFATALDIVPADVGKRIEEMTDEQRWSLGLQLGIVG